VGLAVVAACHNLSRHNSGDIVDQWSKTVADIAMQLPGSSNSHGLSVKERYNVSDALTLARGGYQELTTKWLRFFLDNSNDPHVKHKTLLYIMCSLDDTNVIHRAGFEMAQQVKQEAAHLLENFSIEGLEQMNQSFIARNISPGGAADMLSLTLFLSTLTKQDNN
jgi:triphosphoribosyl-dephospho-CoA synthetase